MRFQFTVRLTKVNECHEEFFHETSRERIHVLLSHLLILTKENLQQMNKIQRNRRLTVCHGKQSEEMAPDRHSELTGREHTAENTATANTTQVTLNRIFNHSERKGTKTGS